jgi:hypothetical protein
MSLDPQPEIREKPPFLRERQADAVGEAPRAWLQLPRTRDDWIQLAAWTLAPGTILALLGPFGSFLAPMWERFAYWVPTMAIGVAIGWFANVWADRQPWLSERPLARILVLSVVITVFMSVVVWLWTPFVFGPNAVRPGPILVFYVWVVSILMGVVGHIYGEYRERQALAAAPPVMESATVAKPATLGQRLKPGLRNATILALEADDHYVRIHTEQGSELILIRLADAIAEMGDVEGARTHRSWWVARAAVKDARRAEGRATLTLSNGAEAPVSRNAMGELVEKGWL